MINQMFYEPEQGTKSQWCAVRVKGGPDLYVKEISEAGKPVILYGFDRDTVKPENNSTVTLLLEELKKYNGEVGIKLVEVPQETLESVIKRMNKTLVEAS